MAMGAQEIQSIHSIIRDEYKARRDLSPNDQCATVILGRVQSMLLRAELARDPRNPFAPLDKPFGMGELHLFGFPVVTLLCAMNYMRFG